MAPEGVERKLAAILSADVVGYSRLMAEDQDGTVRRLATCRDQAGMLVSEHRGRVVDLTGDNFLAEFPTALEAVHCAVNTQRVLKGRNADLPAGRKMEFRIGVHLGAKILQSKSGLGGERKQGTVLFADVKGSMERAEQVDPQKCHRSRGPGSENTHLPGFGESAVGRVAPPAESPRGGGSGMDLLSRIASRLGENEVIISTVVGIAVLAGVLLLASLRCCCGALSPPARPTRGKTILNPH